MPDETPQTQQRRRLDRVNTVPRNNSLGDDIKANQTQAKPQTNIAQKRRALQRKNERESLSGTVSIEKPAKKMIGAGFWMIVGVALIKEIMDPLIIMLQFFTDFSVIAGVVAGTYFDSVAVGVAAGVAAKIVEFIPVLGFSIELLIETPIKILWWALGVVATVTASFIIWLYLVFNGISFGMRKLAILMVVLLVESIPVLNILPSTVLMLFVIRKMENRNNKAVSIKGGL